MLEGLDLAEACRQAVLEVSLQPGRYRDLGRALALPALEDHRMPRVVPLSHSCFAVRRGTDVTTKEIRP